MRTNVRRCWLQCATSGPYFFFNDTATTDLYTLSLHDALPISPGTPPPPPHASPVGRGPWPGQQGKDRKSTRLNSSHSQISYAVFCLKKKSKQVQAGSELDRHIINDGVVLDPSFKQHRDES